MGKKKLVRLILLVLLLAVVVLQFIPVDRSVPEYDATKDFFSVVNAPAEMQSLIKAACYDCHSYETVYPWYAYVAPVSGWIQGHIDHGREECNFSEWGTYSAKKSDHKLEEAVELVKDGEMPLKSFTRFGMHSEANLTDEQRESLAVWLESLRQ